jgi:drug/metabolite transporter (DMT)-like permease
MTVSLPLAPRPFPMTSYQVGILLALAVAMTWTGSALAFSTASRRVGSVPVNLIRLVIALLMLTAVSAIARGRAVPTDATPFQFGWLAASGVVGFFIGDVALFRAFVLIGPRRATLLMALAPAFAAITGWLALGEQLNVMQSLGIFATLVGVMWVIAERASGTSAGSLAPVPGGEGGGDGESAGGPQIAFDPRATAPSPQSSPPITGARWPEVVSRFGIFLGFLGAAGQGVGAVMTKHAFRDGDFDPFACTQIRAAAAIPLFAIFLIASGRTRETFASLRDRRAMGFMTIGAFLGPFLGVSMLNASIQRVPTGVTSTLAGMVPVFMIPVAAIAQRERITPRAAFGALVAVAGVALLAMGD